MTRTISVCTVLLAIGVPASNVARDLAPGEIVKQGQNIYKIRVTNEPIDVADSRAMKRAREYCSRKNQTMAVKDKTFDMGYGYTLTWSCTRPQHTPIDH